MAPIIKAENLGKKFTLLHEAQQHRQYKALRDVIANKAKGLVSRNTTKTSKEDFWALKNLDFEIQQGDRVGIIGRNGSGKSTMLKVLSRIIEPTTGRIEIRGRIASLLEVGTGFHPELSGRENIFLNGTILGMNRREIQSKFDEIVAFAEVERFLDTPVKRYSSGMYVRLAFAVAAHLEPEILIVDEVLAVGDAAFQEKCLGKMKDVSQNQGRTVLFVSHNQSSLRALCNKGIYLVNGSLEMQGDMEPCISQYLNHGMASGEFIPVKRRGSGRNRVTNITTSSEMICGQKCEITFHLDNFNQNTRLDFRIDSILGTRVGWMSTDLKDFKFNDNKVTFSFDNFSLQPGTYNVIYGVYSNQEEEDWCADAFMFDVTEGNYFGTWKLPPREQTEILTDFNVF